MTTVEATRGGPQRIAECGTETAYRRHKRRNEPVDELCRRANREKSRRTTNAARKRAAKAATVAERLPRNAGYGFEWWADAACRRGADPEAFAYVAAQPSATHAEVARTYCAGCPVIQQCADFADRNDCYGVWGGSYRNGAAVVIHPLIEGAPERRIV